MDPNATIKEIHWLLLRITQSSHASREAITERREMKAEAAQLAEDLRVWLRRGGFEPDWSATTKDVRKFIGCGF